MTTIARKHFLTTLSPVHTVAEKCDCSRKRRDNGDSRTFLRQCGFSLLSRTTHTTISQSKICQYVKYLY